MATNTGHVMTLANSIIGVSVLAMPFCFKQCGITLAIVLLIFSSITTRLACHFLVKSSSMCKKRNFEFLAFYTFGPSGKLLVELGIIGFMMGTCVAFFVVIGDLGPEIISKMFQIKNDSTLRSVVLLGLGFCVVLPLGLLRNIESLAAISTVTIGFYFLLVVKIFLESFSHLLAGDWIQKVNFWQPEGVLQCIPIFAMALSCQMQIFEIYESLPSPTLDKMNSVVLSAVNICTIVYISVGFLGYVAYCAGNFSGNILLSFAPSLASEMYKLGFVMSLAVSFPLVIFPCRASLYSLIFRRMPIHHELSQTSSHIPDLRFKCLTAAIVGVAMITGLIIPSIELVLGFLGSTIGVAICIIFPALSFINLTNKETNERITAKVTLLIGIVIMVTGSLANYQAATAVRSTEQTYPELPEVKMFPEVNVLKKGLVSTESAPAKKFSDVKPIEKQENILDVRKIEIKPEIVKKTILDQKKEPLFPVAPVVDIKPSQKMLVSPSEPLIEVKRRAEKSKNVVDVPVIKINEPEVGHFNEGNINKDAIEKEEREIQEIQQQKKKEEDRKEQEFLQKLKEHQNEQKRLLREQQKILNAIKNRESVKMAKDALAKEGSSKSNAQISKMEEFSQKDEIEKKDDKVEKTAERANPGKQLVVKDAEKLNPAPVADIELPKDIAVKAKVASVPLPLAKLQIQSNLQNIVNKNSEIIQSKQEAMGRDILAKSEQGKSVIREKRDMEATEAKIAKKSTEQINSYECAIDEKMVKSPESANKTENVSEVTRTKENVVLENLIKSSQHVSLDLELGGKLKMGENTRMITDESKILVPKKRDLKSIITNRRNAG